MNDWYTIKIHAYRKWLAKKLGNSLFSGPQNKTLEKALQTAENVPKSKKMGFFYRFRGVVHFPDPKVAFLKFPWGH